MMRRWILSGITVIWMILIFSFSAQPASESTQMSHRVGYEVGRLFVPGFSGWDAERQLHFAEKVDYPVRKTAHATECAILAVLLFFTLGTYGIQERKQIALAILLTAVYAATDEFHQLFVPGRSGRITDVMIDTAGAVVGNILTKLVLLAGSKIRKTIACILVICLAATVFPAQAEAEQKFTVTKISEEQKEFMTGVSFPEKGSKIAMSSLREVHIRYYDMNGKKKNGTLIVNKKIAKKTASVFKELYKIKYRIQRVEVVDMYDADDETSMAANNTSAFNYRLIAGSNRLSKHGLGLAIDLNPRINPCVKNGKVSPANAKVYKNRNVKTCKGKYKKYMIHKNDKVYRIFKKYGFSWGGDWHSLKDYQHFEYLG